MDFDPTKQLASKIEELQQQQQEKETQGEKANQQEEEKVKSSSITFGNLAADAQAANSKPRADFYVTLTPVVGGAKGKNRTPNPRQHKFKTNKKPYIIGICGGPSSGMSTVARNIQDDLRNKAGIDSAILNLVDFYVPIRGNMRRNRSRAGSLTLEEANTDEVMREVKTINEQVDFDDPKQIDFDLLVKGLSLLKNQRAPFNKPMYDKILKIRLEKTERVDPCPLIIVEGALIFCHKQLRDLFDLSVFIDTDDDVRLSRRVLKNANKTGHAHVPLPELLKTYEEKTKPAFEKFIEPTKKYANTIIPNYGFSTEKLELDKMTIQGVDVIITHIEQQVNMK